MIHGIEDRDLITVVAVVVKYELASVITMCTARHFDLLNETWIRHRMVTPGNYLIPQRCSPLPTRRSNKSLSQCGNWRWQTVVVGQSLPKFDVRVRSAFHPIATKSQTSLGIQVSAKGKRVSISADDD